MFDPIKTILDNEGGFVNKDNDRGGPTNLGITQKTYTKYLGRIATIEDVMNITEEIAREIYEREYLTGPRISSLNGFLQIKILDMAVNFGPRRAIKLLQRSINKTTLFTLKADGLLGPVTKKAANSCFEWMGRYFINIICDERDKMYRRIVIFNSTQKEFLQGWLNRTEKFRMVLPDIRSN